MAVFDPDPDPDWLPPIRWRDTFCLPRALPRTLTRAAPDWMDLLKIEAFGEECLEDS